MARVAMTIGNHVHGVEKVKEQLSLSAAQRLWGEWELRCLVLVSFGLQAFFLLAAGIRRHNKSVVLRTLLWLAYLSADYVAVFVLGHLTLKMDVPRHQLVLLWAPVLLLHLGGQETITAFSVEDNALWKRHLLGLLTQVGLAAYVVTKSWRINDGLLAAAVALMFVSGTIKYAERTWALKTANSDTTKESRMSILRDIINRSNPIFVGPEKWWLQEQYADLVQAAGKSLPNCMNALLDIPVTPWVLEQIRGMIKEIMPLRGQAAGSGGGEEEEDTFPTKAYKGIEEITRAYRQLGRGDPVQGPEMHASSSGDSGAGGRQEISSLRGTEMHASSSGDTGAGGGEEEISGLRGPEMHASSSGDAGAGGREVEISGLRVPEMHASSSGDSGEDNKDTFPSRAYKLVEIQLSLMYDHLYTKVGLRYAQRWPLVGLGLPLLTLATTSSALALFAAAATMQGGGASYSAADVAVSYVLLAGAVALEVLSILPFTLSFRSYCFLRDELGAGSRLTRAVFWLLRSLRPYDKPLWSNKWALYNLLAGCIKEKQAGVFMRAMRRIGLAGDTELCPISNETKALICIELDDPRRLKLFSGFGHARGTAILSRSGHKEGSVLHDSIANVDFSSSVVMWHLVTDMCFFLGGKPARNDVDGLRHMALAREVSSYLMYLVMECRVLMSSDGHLAYRTARDEVKRILVKHEGARVDAADADAMRKMLEAVGHADLGLVSYEVNRTVLPRASALAQELLHKGQDMETGGGGGSGGAPWKMIASVWIEMLFYLATRCEAGFHAKNLSTGGEFITHVRFLLLNRGIGWTPVL